jgi:hypothetical protein
MSAVAPPFILLSSFLLASVLPKNIHPYPHFPGLLLFFNIVIAFTAYAVPLDEFTDRMSITLTQFLTAMTFRSAAQEKMPNINYQTIIDKYILAGFATMFIQVMGFFFVSRHEPDLSLYTQYSADEAGQQDEINSFLTITDELRPGSILWGILSAPIDEDRARVFDDSFFTFVVVLWMGATFWLLRQWWVFETSTKACLANPAAIWVDVGGDDTDLEEFRENAISKAGRAVYESLPVECKKEWNTFLYCSDMPRLLLWDCQFSKGNINLFTFDGSVKRESQTITVKSNKFGWMQDYFGWEIGLEGIYRSAHVVQRSDAEGRMKDAITDVLANAKPDLFIAAIPEEADASPDLQNKIKTVGHFFSRMNMNTRVLTHEDFGRYEALAVSYACSRQFQETPGVVINVQEHCMRVTMTRF